MVNLRKKKKTDQNILATRDIMKKQCQQQRGTSLNSFQKIEKKDNDIN